MKTVLLFILFCALALPALGELTDADLDKIRLIVQEEIKKETTSLKTEFKNEIATTNEKIDGLDERLRTVEADVSEIKGYQTGHESGTETKISWIIAITSIVAAVVAFGALIANQMKKDSPLETLSKVIVDLSEKKSSTAEVEKDDIENTITGQVPPQQ